MVEKFYQNVDKKNKLEDEKKIKKQEILDQAREHYGFEVDLRDKRYVFSFGSHINTNKKFQLVFETF